MARQQPPKFRANGEPDQRGQGEGSKGTRFKAGDGRPRPGRPKRSRDERGVVQAIRDMPVTITDARGARKKITTLEALLMKQRQKALAGDQRAAEMLFKRFDRYETPSIDGDPSADLLAEDLLILDTVRRRGLLSEPERDEPEDGTEHDPLDQPREDDAGEGQA